MKKFLSIATLMVMALVMCVSCSNDEPVSDTIVGKWKQTCLNGKEGEHGSYRTLDIRADHTFTWSDYNPNGELEESVTGTWKKDGKWRTPTNMEFAEYPKVLFLFDDEDNNREWGILYDDTRMFWLYDDEHIETYPYIKQ